MSYVGLGKMFTTTLSVAGQTLDMSVNVPYEALIASVVPAAVNAAVPELKKQLPGIVSGLMPEVKKQLPGIIDAAAPPLEKYITTRLWPTVLRPIAMKEIDAATGTVSAGASRAGIITGGVLFAGVVAFLVLRKKKA